MILINLETIEKSPMIEIDGEMIVDLTSQILNDNVRLQFDDNDKQYQVGSEMLVKPSLLAQYIFGSASKLDLLAYYNGFSNPFAIPVGYVLRIPELTKINPSVGFDGSSNDNNLARDLFNKKKNIVDEKRKRMLSDDLERPNMNETVRQNTTLSDRLILGTNSINQIKNSTKSFIKEDPDQNIFGLIDYYEEYLSGN